MEFLYTLRKKQLLVKLKYQQLIVKRNGEEKCIPYSEISSLRIKKSPEQFFLQIKFKNNKKILLNSHTFENNKVIDQKELLKTFIKELHIKLSVFPDVKYKTGSPILFGLSLFALFLLLAVLIIFIFDGGDIELPSTGALFVAIPGLIFYLAKGKGRPGKYNPEEF